MLNFKIFKYTLSLAEKPFQNPLFFDYLIKLMPRYLKKINFNMHIQYFPTLPTRTPEYQYNRRLFILIFS